MGKDSFEIAPTIRLRTFSIDLFLGSSPRVNLTNRIVLFYIRYLLKKKTKYCQIILCF